jgi:AbrB family looped-hinge helix DNA binding protein
MVEKVKVSMRGQVVIPKKLRKKLKIEHGIILEVKRWECQIRREYLSLTNPSVLK